MTFEGFFASIIYLIFYLILTFSIFYSFLIIKVRQLNSYQLLEFQNLSGLKLINPFLVLIQALSFFSMAGIPPLGGFLSKFLIFLSLIEINYFKLLLILILISLISAFYYIRPIKLLVFNFTDNPKFLSQVSFFSSLILVLIFLINLFIIVQPQILFYFFESFLNKIYLFI